MSGLMLIVLASAYAGGGVALAFGVGGAVAIADRGGPRRMPPPGDGLRVGLLLACVAAVLLAVTA